MPAATTDELAEWRSIRPWLPTLTLSVREITSVSVTFVLSSPFTGSDALQPDLTLVALGLAHIDDEEHDGAAESDGRRIVSDALAKGLSVKVNGIPWQRVLMKIDDEDEAVIILFGLMPGRQYDVELGLLPGERTLRGQITTDAEVIVERTRSEHQSDAHTDHSASAAADSHTSSSLTLAAPADSAPPAPLPVPALTLEDRRLQLTHTLSVLTAEHAALTHALKSARREAQKADAALRSEIDALRKASDRAAANEQRARQKVLALQEAAKQTLAAADELAQTVRDVEDALPPLERRRAAVEAECAREREAAARVREQREEAERAERRRVERMQAELAALATRLEKLSARREKLEGVGGVVPELEERLRRLEEERERVESDPYGYEGEGGAEDEQDRPEHPRARSSVSPERAPHTHAHPRKRHTHPHPHPHGPFARAAGRPDPIQRPHHHARASLPQGNVPGLINLGPQGLHPRRSAHAHHPHASVLAGAGGNGSGNGSPSSSSSASTPSGLSSRAPPFEPRAPPSVSSGRSELNPDSAPFSPRSILAQAAAAGAKVGETGGPRRGSLG